MQLRPGVFKRGLDRCGGQFDLLETRKLSKDWIGGCCVCVEVISEVSNYGEPGDRCEIETDRTEEDV